MAWIYLAESEESPRPWLPGSERSPIVKTTDMLKEYSCRECEAEPYLSRLSGMMCGHFLQRMFPHRFMSSPEDSRARTSALQELVQDWEASDPVSSSKSSDSLANFDLSSFSWKTSQLSLFGGLTEFSWSSLRWGSIVDGRLYQPQRWEPRTSGSDGSYLPTPTATDYGSNNHGVKEGKAESKGSLGTMARSGLWPTPMASRGDYQKKNGRVFLKLAGAVKRWPTPKASEASRGDCPADRNRNSPCLTTIVNMDSGKTNGQLNPTWVEWLMGYPLEWTALEDWAMQWFRSKHGRRSPDSRAQRALADLKV